MTQTNLLELAKQGEPEAIAALMNRSLQSKGIEASVIRQGDRLQVMLESEKTLNQQLLTTFVRNGLGHLGLDSIHSVNILGRQHGDDNPSWAQTISLDPTTADGDRTSPQTYSSFTTAQSPTPAPPPPPPFRASSAAPPPTAADYPVTPVPTAQPFVSSDIASESEALEPPVPAEADSTPDVTTTIQPETHTTIQSDDDVLGPTEPDLAGQPASASDPFQDVAPLPDVTPHADAIAASPSDPETAETSGQPYSDSEYLADDWPADEGLTAAELENRMTAETLPTQDGSFTDSQVYDGEVEDGAYSSQPLNEPTADAVSRDRIESSALVPASYPGIHTQKSPKPASRVLFIAIAIITAGLSIGLIGYSLWAYLTTPTSFEEQELPPPDAPPADPEAVNPTNADELSAALAGTGPLTEDQVPLAIQEASERAANAVTLAQSAQSNDDWNLVINQWQRAIALLERVPDSSPNYAAAQQQLASYRASLASAEQQITDQPVSSTPLPSTVVTLSNDIACPAVNATGESQPVELTNVQLTTEQVAAGSQQLIGCITNYTDQTIASVSITYQGASPDGESEEAGAAAEGQGVLTFTSLEPGETVPFRGGFDIPADLTNLQITTISWLPVGAAQPEQLEVTLSPSAAPE